MILDLNRTAIHTLSEALSQYIENAGDPQDWSNDEAARFNEAAKVLNVVDQQIADAAK
jgi:hypothetical protein